MYSLKRIKTLTFYYLSSTINKPAKILLMLIWPMLDLVIWGITTIYIQQNQLRISNYLIFMLSAIIFWNIVLRTQQEIFQELMLDVFSKNFSNILITPLKLWEIIFSLILASFIKLALIISILSVFAYLLFSFNIFSNTLLMLYFLINLLLFGWSLGIATIGVIIRFGYRFESIVFALPYVLLPFVCIPYPRSSLPQFMQKISWFIPTSYVFEEMRNSLIYNSSFTVNNPFFIVFLNIFSLVLSIVFLTIMFRWARKNGILAKI